MNRNSPALRSQTATPPRGDCICGCQLTQESHDNQKFELKPCGELCAEIQEKTLEYTETWTEKDDACGSGKRTYSRKTTIFIRARSTKMEGTITLKQYRVSPLGDDWKPLSDCATCPPCPDQVDKHPCGSIVEYCAPQEDDTKIEQSDPLPGDCIDCEV